VHSNFGYYWIPLNYFNFPVVKLQKFILSKYIKRLEKLTERRIFNRYLGAEEYLQKGLILA